MELYDKKYVYFDWDDRLKGKKVFLSDTIDWIKSKVNEGMLYLITETKKSRNPSKPFKLKFSDDVFTFAYYDPFYEMKKAYLEGETLEYKYPNDDDIGWLIYNENHMPHFDTHDGRYEWRIKPRFKFNFDDIIDYSNYQPTEPKYYLSINKNDSYLEFTISQIMRDSTFYNGSKKECERMLKIIHDEFGDCGSCKGEGVPCHHCGKLTYIVDRYSREKYEHRMTNRELAEWLAKGNGEMKNLGYVIGTSTSYCYRNNTENENVNDNILIRDFGSDEWREPLIEV